MCTARVITVASGKGGVGKSHLAANLATLAARRGLKVLAFDADTGLANLDLLLGASPERSLRHVLEGGALSEAVVHTDSGPDLLAAQSGTELRHLSVEQRHALMCAWEEISRTYELVVVDAGPGIGREVMLFCACGHDVALVMTPEPTCVSDAVQLLEALGNNGGAGVSVVVNLARTDRTGQAVFARLLDAVPQLPLRYAGSVPEDHNVRRAVHVRRPLVDVAPTSPASRAFSRLLDRMLGEVPQAPGALAQRSA